MLLSLLRTDTHCLGGATHSEGTEVQNPGFHADLQLMLIRTILGRAYNLVTSASATKPHEDAQFGRRSFSGTSPGKEEFGP